MLYCFTYTQKTKRKTLIVEKRQHELINRGSETDGGQNGNLLTKFINSGGVTVVNTGLLAVVSLNLHRAHPTKHRPSNAFKYLNTVDLHLQGCACSKGR